MLIYLLVSLNELSDNYFSIRLAETWAASQISVVFLVHHVCLIQSLNVPKALKYIFISWEILKVIEVMIDNLNLITG